MQSQAGSFCSEAMDRTPGQGMATMMLMFWLLWQTAAAGAPDQAAPWPDHIPHETLLRELRERGQVQLALDHVRNLKRQPGFSGKEWADRLAYWQARLQLDLHVVDRQIPQAHECVQAAENALTAVAGAMPQHPLAIDRLNGQAELYLDLGRIIALLAKETKDANQVAPLSKQASQVLQHAEKGYLESTKHWEAQVSLLPKVASTPESKTQAQMVYQGYLRSLMGQALCWQEMARLPGLADQSAGERFLKSTQILEKAAGLRDQHPLGWQALAMQAHFTLGLDSRKAEDLYQRVLKERRADAQLGQCHARYYRLLDLAASARGGRKALRAQYRQEVEAWYNDYPHHLFTTMGQTLRYHLANFLLEDVLELEESQRSSETAKQTLQRALQLFELVEGSATEWASAAESQFIATWMLLAKNPPPLTTQSSFRECLLRGQVAYQQIQEWTEKIRSARDPAQQKPLLEQRDQLIQDLHQAAEFARQRIPKELRPRDADRLHSLLFEAAFRKSDWEQAAQWADLLRKRGSHPELARSAALQTLRMRQILASRSEEAQQRLRATALEVLRDYPISSAGDLAREILGLSHYQDKQYPEAIGLLEKITPQHERFALCRFYAGLAHWHMHLELVRKSQFPLHQDTASKRQAFQFMEEAVEAANQISSQQPITQATAMRVNLADLHGRCGNWQRTAELLAPLVDRLHKRDRMPEVSNELTTQILGLALRAEIQRNPTGPETLKLLQLLQAQENDSALGSSTSDLLRDLGRQLRQQLDQIDKEGPAAMERAKVLRKNFIIFLNQVEKIPHRPMEFTFWLASQYAALGELNTGRALFQAIPAPAPNAPAQDWQVYRQGRLTWAVSLRQFATSTSDAALRTAAVDLLDSSLNAIMQEEWAKKHPALVRERIMVDQLRGRYVAAIEQWDRLRHALEAHVHRGTMYKELYYDCHEGLIECLHAESQKQSDQEMRDRHLRRAAQIYLMLRAQEFGGPDRQTRMEAFLNQPNHAELKNMVQQLQR